MSKYYVICGTRQEYNEFIQKKALELFGQGDTSVSLSQFVYVNSSDQLIGRVDPHGWFIGTWRDRSNIHEILHVLRTRYLKEKIPEAVKEAINEILPSQS
jgi:hypothetical protein